MLRIQHHNMVSGFTSTKYPIGVPHTLGIILGLALVLMISGPLTSQEESSNHEMVNLLAGAAHADISPSTGVYNWVTGEPYGVIHDSIYARALVISDGVHKVVILHWELVDVGESARDQIRSRIAQKLDIPEENILVNAAHNHSAPWCPVYGEDNQRGKERYPWWAVRYMEEQDDEPHFREWKEKLLTQSLMAVEQANDRLVPATMWLGRYDVSQYIRNRRPRPVKYGVVEAHLPDTFNYRHEDWDPRVLSGDRTFGPLDRTMTVLSFRNSEGENVSTIFQMACHAVSIYPFQDGISGDWPGAVSRELARSHEGETMFLQGAAGNVNPWRRGEEAVNEMAEGLAHDISLAYDYSAQLMTDSIRTDRAVVGIPITDYAQESTGLENIDAEIMAITIGSLVLVTLPGEPMTELNLAIQKESPFPQTLVLGYSNGNGGHYCGMPGEKAYGGYETGERTNLGTDQAGQIMVNTAIGLLEKMDSKK